MHRTLGRRAFFFFFFFGCCGLLFLGAAEDIVVNTPLGAVKGFQNESFRAFKGIPYAEPPVGDLRWESTVPAKAWSPATLDALDFKPGCPQHCSLPEGFCPPKQSEDCLYLDVWTPSNPAPKGLPVMVFFAGGAFFQGAGNTPIYWGNYFVNKTDTILVTNSYRLGALGFMVTSQFKGNYGIEDQREVLRWVQKNIASFGGDPNRVTIFGESAGAQSIGVHLVSPQSEGLFQKAILESDPLALEFKPTWEAKGDGDSLANKLGCKPEDVACLRSKSAQEVVDKQHGVFVFPPIWDFDLNVLLQWTPTVDGVQLKGQPLALIEKGDFHKVPVMMGTNANEGIMFVYQAAGFKTSWEDYVGILVAGFREEFFQVYDHYPVPFETSDSRPYIAKVVTQYLFGCSTRRAAESISKYVNNTFLYYFDHKLSFPAYGPNYAFCDDYVCHGSELPFVFQTATLLGFKYSPEEKVMAQNMLHYWTNFAHSSDGDPNFPNRPISVKWPAFDTSSYRNIHLATPVSQQSGLTKVNCDMWDTLGYDW